MKIKDNPKLVLGLLGLVFVFALALALYLPGYGGGSTLLQTNAGNSVAAGSHIVYVHYVHVGDSRQNVTIVYSPTHCVYHS